MGLQEVPVSWSPNKQQDTRSYCDIEVQDTHCFAVAGGLLVSNSHITLAEPFPNPIFEKPIKALAHLTTDQYDGLVSGALGVDPDTGEVTKDGKVRGGEAFHFLLSRINRDARLDELREMTLNVRGSKLDALIKEFKILRGLRQQGLQPTVYAQKLLPVLPPNMRPVTITASGDISRDDMNGILLAVAMLNEQLRSMPKSMPESEKAGLRAELYDALKSLAGLEGDLNQQGVAGVLNILHGSELKHGYFQKMLLKRRQDLTARGVITPDLHVGVNEIGLPRDVARTLYEPFLIAELVKAPYSMTSAKARDVVRADADEESETVTRVLESVMAKRPLAMKRDPVLHKHGVQGFTPRLIGGKSIRINPLVVIGFNADHDGDTVSMYVPITAEAIDEVRKMMPTHNILSPATGQLMYMPTLESSLGLFLMTQMGKGTDKKFKDSSSVMSAYRGEQVAANDVVLMGGKRTTAGRVAVGEMLPDGDMKDKVLYDPDFTLTKGNLSKLLVHYAKRPDEFTRVVDRLKELGFVAATGFGWSVGIKDFKAVSDIRDKVLEGADAEAAKVKASDPHRDDKLIDIYTRAERDMKAQVEGRLKGTDNKLFETYSAGTKLSWTQLRQIIATPLLTTGPDGVIPIPIRRSYAEGLPMFDFWLSANGARKSMYDKTQEVSIPGAINKQLAHVAMDLVVVGKDCGAKGGILIPLGSDVVDRILAEPVKVRGSVIPRGTVITPDVLTKIQTARGSGSKGVLVRSPLKHQGKGMCQQCYGIGPDGRLPEIGTNIGLIATSAFGERGVQLALRQFHTGGAAAGRNVLSAMDRVKQLVRMPEILPNSATLSHVTGQVKSVEKDPAGGHSILVSRAGDKGHPVEDVRHYVPQDQDVLVKPGDPAKRGRPLSSGVVNPKELLGLSGVPAVQSYLTDEISGLYRSEGVRRIHSEVLVKALTNLGKVVDAGDHPDLLPEDTTSVSTIEAWNADNPDKKPIRYEPILKGVELLPLEQTEDVLARMAYRRPADTLLQAAAENLSSELHGHHPVPGMVFGAEFGKPPPGSKSPY